jgi:hypothetical protein
MNSRERVRRAMRHETPDRVPVMCQLALGHYFLHSSRRPAEIWFDSSAFVDTLLEFQQRYRFDGILLNLPGRPSDWQEYLKQTHPGPSETLFWRNGLQTQFVPDDNPHTFPADGSELDRADYRQIDPDDPAILRLPGYVWNTWHAPHLWDIPESADLTDPAAYPDWFTAGLRRARQLGDSVSVHVEVFAPLTHLMELFGYENALLALLDVPATCHRLLSMLTRVVVAQVQCCAPHQPDAVLISSAFAGAGFISRAMYAEFVLPYEAAVADAIRRFQIPVYTHTCGAIGDRLDLMIQTGIDGSRLRCRKVPFLLPTMTSGIPSPFKSAAATCVPTPESSWIKWGTQRTLLVADQLEPVDHGWRVGFGISFGTVSPEAFAGHQIHHTIAVDIGQFQGVQLADAKIRPSSRPVWASG